MRPHVLAAAVSLLCALASGRAHADDLRWLSSQLDADARVAGNTDEVQLIVSVSYLRTGGSPRARSGSRAAGVRYGVGLTGEVGGVATNRCTLGVDCFLARLGATAQLEWAAGSIRRNRVHSNRALFVRLTPHVGWVDVDSGYGGVELGISGGVGIAFAVKKQKAAKLSTSTTIVTVQALATQERDRVFLGLALGVSLR